MRLRWADIEFDQDTVVARSLEKEPQLEPLASGQP
jgi:hypothetical protein